MDTLKVRDLSIAFGGVQALKSVSFDVQPGEIVGLIGPNGAGKTSLINCISGYYHPECGSIEFAGADLRKLPPYRLRELGISRSFQELRLPPTLSVIDNIVLGQHFKRKTNLLRAFFDFQYLKTEEHQCRGEARRIMRFLADTRQKSELSQRELGYPDVKGRGGYPDLLDVQDVPIKMLPFGIRKKVDLARAFVSEPKLLLLDEPAAGLASGDLDEVTTLLREFHDRYKPSILLVEHKIPLVMKLCHRIIVLNFGSKIAEGTPEQIRNNPAVIDAYLGTKKITVEMKQHTETISTPPILEVKGIDLYYGRVKALSGVSLKVHDRSVTAVLGSNGAGKSTLLRAISGIERLANGEVLFQGSRLCHYLQNPRPDQIVKKGVIHVAEGRRIFKELSVTQNLKIAARTRLNRMRFYQNLEKVFHYFPVLKSQMGLKDAGNMSGGQQQMLAIAMGLILEPKLLLLDEPSLGLSPSMIEEIIEIIQRIGREQNCAILLVEQNAEIALRYSEFAYVLDQGFVARSGKSSTLLKNNIVQKYYLGT